jgi:hypothetical protein
VHDYQCEEEEISVESLIEEQRWLSACKNPFKRVVGSLCVAGALKERLAALSDAMIGRLMFTYVLDDLNLLSPTIIICQVATERLLGRPVRDGENEELGGE